jgi:hypothetical protein
MNNNKQKYATIRSKYNNIEGRKIGEFQLWQDGGFIWE